MCQDEQPCPQAKRKEEEGGMRRKCTVQLGRRGKHLGNGEILEVQRIEKDTR